MNNTLTNDPEILAARRKAYDSGMYIFDSSGNFRRKTQQEVDRETSNLRAARERVRSEQGADPNKSAALEREAAQYKSTVFGSTGGVLKDSEGNMLERGPDGNTYKVSDGGYAKASMLANQKLAEQRNQKASEQRRLNNNVRATTGR